MLQKTQLWWISKVAYHLLELVVVVLITVLAIELSGVQFGVKPYVRFQNRTSEQREFDLKSMISDQNYTPLISIATLLHPFRNIHLGKMLQNSPHNSFLSLSLSGNFVGDFKQAFKSDG